jgi:hypothetical protein
MADANPRFLGQESDTLRAAPSGFCKLLLEPFPFYVNGMHAVLHLFSNAIGIGCSPQLLFLVVNMHVALSYTS